MLTPKRGVPFFLAMALLSVTPHARTQMMGATVALRASPQGRLTDFWEVQAAGIREDLAGMGGFVQARNVTNETLTHVLLYAEYFDVRGRHCFSLLLGQEEPGPLLPDQIAYFGGTTTGLFASTEATEVRLYLMKQSAYDRENSKQEWQAKVRVPVTTYASVDTISLPLGSAVGTAPGQLVDLILASVKVDERGLVTDIRVLQDADDSIRSWFLDFVRQKVPFYPSSVDGAFASSEVLVMVRAFQNPTEGSSTVSPLSPRSSPWIASYTKDLPGSEVPVVMNIVFTRPETTVMRDGKPISLPAAPPGLYEIRLLFGDWSDQVFRWVREESMPRHFRREFIFRDSP